MVINIVLPGLPAQFWIAERKKAPKADHPAYAGPPFSLREALDLAWPLGIFDVIKAHISKKTVQTPISLHRLFSYNSLFTPLIFSDGLPFPAPCVDSRCLALPGGAMGYGNPPKGLEFPESNLPETAVSNGRANTSAPLPAGTKRPHAAIPLADCRSTGNSSQTSF